MVKTTLWRSSLRHLQQHPLQLFLAILGIALGVAVVVAVDLANQSAKRAFQLSSETLTGRATHYIVAGPTGVDDELYVSLRRNSSIQKSAPVITGQVSFKKETLQLMGVDLFAESAFRNFANSGVFNGRPQILREILTVPGTVLLTNELADTLELKLGDKLSLKINGESRQIQLAGLYTPPASQAILLSNILVTDISTAQELLQRAGKLSRIDLILHTDAEIALIQSLLPTGHRLLASDTRSLAMGEMTRAFTLNLTAMSLLALVVGMFLIYNSISFSVLQRRELLGSLRVIGATRRDIMILVVGEALLIGSVGTVIGLALGVLLAQELIVLVTRTINDLYFVLNVSDLLIQPLVLVKGVLLGMVATLVSVLVPASEAALAPPRSVQNRSRIEGHFREIRLPLTWIGFACCAIAGIILLASSNLISGFVSLFILILGFSLLVPTLAAWCSSLTIRLFRSYLGVAGRMAIGGVRNSLSRTGVAIAALSIAISTTVGVGVMIESFRGSVQHWLEATLRGDIYVSPDISHGGSNLSYLKPEIINNIKQLPDIDHISMGRSAKIESANGITQLFAVHMAPESYGSIEILDGEPKQAWNAYKFDQALLISEPYSYRHKLKTGDTLQLETDQGTQQFRIAGVYRDYGSEHGVVSMRMSLYQKLWNDNSVYSLGIYLKPHAEPEPIIRQIQAIAQGRQELRARSNRTIHKVSLDTFDRTFVITNVLRLLAICVAFVGILSALLALQLERSRELAIMRATGLTQNQLWRLTITQTGFMGMISGLLAVPLGLLMGVILIFVINRRAFGWSMEFILPGGVLIEALLLALLSALLAGILPAWRMSKKLPAAALREE